MRSMGREGKAKGKGKGWETYGVPVADASFPGLSCPPDEWWHRARGPALQLLQMRVASPQRRGRKKKPQKPREAVRREGKRASQQPSPGGNLRLCPLNAPPFSQVAIRLHISPHHFFAYLVLCYLPQQAWAPEPRGQCPHLVIWSTIPISTTCFSLRWEDQWATLCMATTQGVKKKKKPPDFNPRVWYVPLDFQIPQHFGFQEQVDLNIESSGRWYTPWTPHIKQTPV